MSAGALVIKNAILALLVILIIHFAIKNMLFEKQLDNLRVKEEMTMDETNIVIPSTLPYTKPIATPANPNPVVKCEEGNGTVKPESDLESLYKYVFAGNTANEKATKTELTVKPSKEAECTAANSSNSNSMFAAYDNKELVFSAW